MSFLHTATYTIIFLTHSLPFHCNATSVTVTDATSASVSTSAVYQHRRSAKAAIGLFVVSFYMSTSEHGRSFIPSLLTFALICIILIGRRH